MRPNSEVHEDEDRGLLRCAPGLLRPGVLLLLLCCFVLMQSMIISGLTPAVITSLERRLKLQSIDSGMLIAAYDIGVVLLVLPVSHFGKYHKMRILGGGLFLLGVGSMIFSLAHFTGGKYNPAISSGLVCAAGNPMENCEDGKSSSYGYLIAGMIIMGIGAAPLYTLGPAVLDDALPKNELNVFLGVFYALTAIGTALGFLVGGATLNLYVDGASPAGLDTLSPQWVGRWWVCYVAIFIFAVISSVPFFLFPKYLPGSAHIRAAKLTDIEVEGDSAGVSEETGLLDSTKILLKNKVFMCNIFAQAFETFLVSAAASFLSKAVEAQYGVSASTAATVTGAVVIPGAAGGTFIGGLIMEKIKPRAKTLGFICFSLSAATLLLTPIFFIGCDSPTISGLNQPFPDAVTTDRFRSCNFNCSCGEVFRPMCGEDGLTFYNPCFAGCSSRVDEKTFGNCACTSRGIANDGECPESVNCRKGILSAFLICLFVIMFITFLTNTPSNMIILRVLPLHLRPTGLAISGIIYRTFGGIPGPIVLGAMLDTTCDFESKSCHSGECVIYNTQKMRLMFFLVAVCCKGVITLLYFSSWRFFKDEKENFELKELNLTPCPPLGSTAIITPQLSRQNITVDFGPSDVINLPLH